MPLELIFFLLSNIALLQDSLFHITRQIASSDSAESSSLTSYFVSPTVYAQRHNATHVLTRWSPDQYTHPISVHSIPKVRDPHLPLLATSPADGTIWLAYVTEWVALPFSTPLSSHLTFIKPPTGIQDVPPEIMIMIFKSVLLDEDETLESVFRYPWMKVDRAVAIVKLSHVCRFWRAIALGYPGFWTRADGHSIAQLYAFIARSRQYPLSLFLSTRTTGLCDVLRTYGSRIERLDITVCDNSGYLEELDDFVDSTRLQCLTLNHERYNDVFQHDASFFLLGKQTLLIKALSIVSLSGHFPANHFPNLTHLRLSLTPSRDRMGHHLPLSMSLFDLLRNTPKLEFLTIYSIGTDTHGFDQEPTEEVPLPHLRSLVLMLGDLDTVIMFLERLSLPETTFVRLQNICVTDPQVPLLPSLGAVQSIDRLSLTTESTCLQMVAEGPSSGLWLSFKIDDSEGSNHGSQNDGDNADNADNTDDAGDDEDEEAKDGEEVEVEIEDESSWDDWLRQLPTLLPLAQVSYMDIYVGAHRNILSDLLPHMQGLTELSIRLKHQYERLGGHPASSMALVMYQLLAQVDPVICPTLRKLNIDVDGYHVNAILDLHPYELKEMVLLRRRLGHPIQHVVLQPFADEHVVKESVWATVSERFDTLKEELNCVELRGPGLPTIPYEHADWDRWHINGAEEYWPQSQLEKLMYLLPWYN